MRSLLLCGGAWRGTRRGEFGDEQATLLVVESTLLLEGYERTAWVLSQESFEGHVELVRVWPKLPLHLPTRLIVRVGCEVTEPFADASDRRPEIRERFRARRILVRLKPTRRER